MANEFNSYLESIGEIGFVEELVHSMVYVSGLPEAHPNELVFFESGAMGQVFSLGRENIEILLFNSENIKVGDKVVRTGKTLEIPVGNNLLGRLIDPLGKPLDSLRSVQATNFVSVDADPPKLLERDQVHKPLLTGVTVVDLVVPLSKGQRELVIGDRKTGKTEFLETVITTQAKLGTVCIYAVIGQKQLDIKKLYEYFTEKGVKQNTIIVASSPSDPSGLIYLTPFSATAIAEFFKNQGLDVLLVLDDMSTHARTYREISLLARRFPGRSSYPGDIFYLHARLNERAGNFKKGSITMLPVSESILGDLSGYIQTNLMAMTDGHIFFDIDLYNQGKRPAVNPFLSVTRVGHQTQTPLQRDVSREVLSFLVTYERMKQFMHFGAEVGDLAKNVLNLGGKIDTFLSQKADTSIPININIFILAGLWAGLWNESKNQELPMEFERLMLVYQTEDEFKKKVDELTEKTASFSELVNIVRRGPEIITEKLAGITKKT